MAQGLANIKGVTKKEIEELQQMLNDLNKLIGSAANTGGTTTVGTVMAKLNKLLTDWTNTRAGKIDTIHTNVSNLNTRLTSTRGGYLDKLANFGATGDTGGTSTGGTLTAKVNTALSNIGQTGNTGGSASAGTIMAKLNKLLTDWTSTRAGYIDKLANFGTTGETGGSTTSGTMMAKLNKLLGDWTTTRAGYINTINTNTSRLTTTRAGYIDKLANFGATGDTGGSTTAGTMMAKLNAILQKVITEGVGVKSVQRGTFQETSTSQDSETAITVRLTTINPAKTFIILNGGLSAGYSGSSSAVRGYIGSVGTTNFVYKTGRASLTIINGFVSWQAVEFY